MKADARLVELDISDNALGPMGMPGINDLLKSPSCFNLQELKLNNTGCGVTGGKALAKTLLECHTASKGQLALKVFILGRSRQENEGAIGKKHALKKYDQCVLNTSCFLGGRMLIAGSNIKQVVQFHEIFV